MNRSELTEANSQSGREVAPSGWQPIETAPKPHDWFSTKCRRYLIACFKQYEDDDGELGAPELVWANVAYLSSSGWMVSSTAFRGLHGNCSFPLADTATHWQPLPAAPDGGAGVPVHAPAETATGSEQDLILSLTKEVEGLKDEVERLRGLLNTPELHDFSKAVVLEAAHQRERWGVDHDAGKEPADWFWLLGYLGGKALRSAQDGNTDKALHHCISSAAALANWHAAISGADNRMRPGIDPDRALSTSGRAE